MLLINYATFFLNLNLFSFETLQKVLKIIEIPVVIIYPDLQNESESSIYIVTDVRHNLTLLLI